MVFDEPKGEFVDLDERKTKQDPDIKKGKGTEPAKYYAKDAEGKGMAKSTKKKRDTHFTKGAKMSMMTQLHTNQHLAMREQKLNHLSTLRNINKCLVTSLCLMRKLLGL